MGKSTFTAPRAVRNRARILAAVAATPLTTVELAEKLHMTRDSMNQYLAVMRAERRLYIASHVYNPNGRPAPRYLAGDQPDAIYKPTRAKVDKVAERKRQIIATLRGRPRTALFVADAIGLTSASVRRYIAELRAAGQVRISTYTRHAGNGYQPLYGLGSAEDAPWPTPETPEQTRARQRDWWADNRDRISEQRRHNRRIKIPQTPFSALFG